jgi:predicted metal-dependent hydrolase
MEVLRYKDIDVEVRRSSRRRTVDLTVDRGGNVVMAVPAAFSDANIRDILQKKELWLYQTLGGKRKVLHPKRPREYVSGEGFYYLGKNYRLKVTTGPPESPLSLKEGRFWLCEDALHKAREEFISWYANHAEHWIGERLEMLQERAGARPQAISVRDLGFRWGSCGKNGTLYFNWRTILLPPKLVCYLVVHELVHLREYSHNHRFYEILGRAVPDYKELEQWLKENGDRYDL